MQAYAILFAIFLRIVAFYLDRDTGITAIAADYPHRFP